MLSRISRLCCPTGRASDVRSTYTFMSSRPTHMGCCIIFTHLLISSKYLQICPHSFVGYEDLSNSFEDANLLHLKVFANHVQKS